MNSVKSLCNKAIIKADLKRYWWTGAIYSLLIFLLGVFPFLDRFWYDGKGDMVDFWNSYFCSRTEAVLIAAVIMPVVIGVFLFSYLQKSSSVTTAHAYPVKRAGLYASHIISGMVLMTGAVLINSIILILSRSNENIYMMCSMKFIAVWTLLVILYSTVVFSISVLCSMVTGSTAAAFVLSYIIGAFPAFAELIITTIAFACLKGFHYEGGQLIIDKLYFNISKMGDNYGLGIWIYIIISILAFLSGFAFYKKRHLENHTSVLAFKSLKPVLVYSFGICIGLIGCLYISSFRNNLDVNENNLLIMLPFGIIGVIIAKMLIALSFRPKGILKPIILYTIFVFCLIGFFKFDISGFEKRIPDMDKIEYITLERERDMTDYRYVNGKRVRYNENAPHRFKSPETIKLITDMHSELINYEYSNRMNYRSIYINYKLKNGKNLQREYYVNYDFYGQKALFDNEEYKKSLFLVLQDNPNISTINIRASVFSNLYTPDSDTQLKILDALKKDAMLITYDEHFARNNDIGLNFVFNMEYDAIDSSGNKTGETVPDSRHLNAYESGVNTIALMKELDITSRAAEKIIGLNIGQKIVTDPAKIRFIAERLIFNCNDTSDKEKELLYETASITPVDTDTKSSIEAEGYDGTGCFVVINIGNTYHSPYFKCTQEEYNWLIS